MASSLGKAGRGLFRLGSSLRNTRGLANSSTILSAAESSEAGSRATDIVYTELNNVPTYTLKEDVLGLFRGCNVSDDRVYPVLNEKLRVKFWRVEFLAMDDFEKALEAVQQSRRMGTRNMRLHAAPEQAMPLSDPINTMIKPFRGCSVVMTGLPVDLRTESIERFFLGYDLAPSPPLELWVDASPPGMLPNRGDRFASKEARFGRTGKERRMVVKFSTRAEALRALREKQGTFLQDSLIQLRLLQ